MIKFIKIILFLGILAAAAYALSASALYPVPGGRAKGRISKNVYNQNKDYSALLTKIETARLFTALARQGAPGASPAAESLGHAAENLRLAGVMTSGGTQAIIEDKKKGATIYLKEGETFGDNICVEKINNDSVLLTRGGEQAELRL